MGVGSIIQVGHAIQHKPLPSLASLQLPQTEQLSRGCSQSSHSKILGGFLGGGQLIWRAIGSTIEVIDPATCSRQAAWTFGAIMHNEFAKVTSVCGIGVGTVTHVAVGIDLGVDRRPRGMVGVLSLRRSRVTRAFHFINKVTRVCMVTGGERLVDPSTLACELSSSQGLITVVTENAQLYLLDLALDLGGDEVTSDEVSMASYADIVVPDARAEMRRNEAVSRHLHPLLCLSDSMSSGGKFRLISPDDNVLFETSSSSISITAITYISQLASLVIGYSFGSFQIINLSNIAIDCTSPYDPGLPVFSFAYQEPENDPKSFVYLWVTRSTNITNEEISASEKATCSLYSMNYDKKEWIEGYGLWYQGLISMSPKFEFDALGSLGLEDTYLELPSAIFSTMTIISGPNGCYQPVSGSDALASGEEDVVAIPDNSHCLFGLEASHLEQGSIVKKHYVAIFDINQWYQSQMPSHLHLSSDRLCSYLSFHVLDRVPMGMDEHILTSCPKMHSWSRHRTRGQKNSDWYPSALSYELQLVTSEGLVLYKCPSVQQSALQGFLNRGPAAILDPHQSFLSSLFAGIIANDNGSLGASLSLVSKREHLLNVALENNLLSLLMRCVSEFSDGRFTHLGCSLKVLLDWAWERVYAIKADYDQHCAPLFSSSGELLSPDTLSHLHQDLSIICHLHTIISAINNSARDVTKLSAQQLEGRAQITHLLQLHLQISLWFYHCGLLPQESGEQELSGDDNLVPYPAQMLTRIYKERREEIKGLSSTLDGSEILLIDSILHDSSSDLVEIWSCKERECGNGIYPPPSLHALLSIYLLPNIPLTTKHQIVQYVFLDLASMLSDSFSNVVEELVKFPSSFSLSPSLIKLTQAFWLIDHKDYQNGLSVLLDPLVNPDDISLIQHQRIVKSFLFQGQEQCALTYSQLRHPPRSRLEDIRLHLTLLLANGRIREAFHYQRQHRIQANAKDLLNHIFMGCEHLERLENVIHLPLSSMEEKFFIEFLNKSKNSKARDILLVYHLQQSRYCDLANLNSASSGQNGQGTREALVQGYLSHLSTNGQRKAAPQIGQKSLYAKPQPLSARIRQNFPNTPKNKSKLSMISSPRRNLNPVAHTPFRTMAQRRNLRGIPESSFTEQSFNTTPVRDDSHIVFPTIIDSPLVEVNQPILNSTFTRTMNQTIKGLQSDISKLMQDILVKSLHGDELDISSFSPPEPACSAASTTVLNYDVLKLLKTPPAAPVHNTSIHMGTPHAETPQSILKVRQIAQRPISPSLSDCGSPIIKFPQLRTAKVMESPKDLNVSVSHTPSSLCETRQALTPKHLRFRIPSTGSTPPEEEFNQDQSMEIGNESDDETGSKEESDKSFESSHENEVYVENNVSMNDEVVMESEISLAKSSKEIVDSLLPANINQDGNSSAISADSRESSFCDVTPRKPLSEVSIKLDLDSSRHDTSINDMYRKLPLSSTLKDFEELLSGSKSINNISKDLSSQSVKTSSSFSYEFSKKTITKISEENVEDASLVLPSRESVGSFNLSHDSCSTKYEDASHHGEISLNSSGESDKFLSFEEDIPDRDDRKLTINSNSNDLEKKLAEFNATAKTLLDINKTFEPEEMEMSDIIDIEDKLTNAKDPSVSTGDASNVGTGNILSKSIDQNSLKFVSTNVDEIVSHENDSISDVHNISSNEEECGPYLIKDTIIEENRNILKVDQPSLDKPIQPIMHEDERKDSPEDMKEDNFGNTSASYSLLSSTCGALLDKKKMELIALDKNSFNKSSDKVADNAFSHLSPVELTDEDKKVIDYILQDESTIDRELGATQHKSGPSPSEKEHFNEFIKDLPREVDEIMSVKSSIATLSDDEGTDDTIVDENSDSDSLTTDVVEGKQLKADSTEMDVEDHIQKHEGDLQEEKNLPQKESIISLHPSDEPIIKGDGEATNEKSLCVSKMSSASQSLMNDDFILKYSDSEEDDREAEPDSGRKDLDCKDNLCEIKDELQVSSSEMSKYGLRIEECAERESVHDLNEPKTLDVNKDNLTIKLDEFIPLVRLEEESTDSDNLSSAQKSTANLENVSDSKYLVDSSEDAKLCDLIQESPTCELQMDLVIDKGDKYEVTNDNLTCEYSKPIDYSKNDRCTDVATVVKIPCKPPMDFATDIENVSEVEDSHLICKDSKAIDVLKNYEHSDMVCDKSANFEMKKDDADLGSTFTIANDDISDSKYIDSLKKVECSNLCKSSEISKPHTDDVNNLESTFIVKPEQTSLAIQSIIESKTVEEMPNQTIDLTHLSAPLVSHTVLVDSPHESLRRSRRLSSSTPTKLNACGVDIRTPIRRSRRRQPSGCSLPEAVSNTLIDSQPIDLMALINKEDKECSEAVNVNEDRLDGSVRESNEQFNDITNESFEISNLTPLRRSKRISLSTPSNLNNLELISTPSRRKSRSRHVSGASLQDINENAILNVTMETCEVKENESHPSENDIVKSPSRSRARTKSPTRILAPLTNLAPGNLGIITPIKSSQIIVSESPIPKKLLLTPIAINLNKQLEEFKSDIGSVKANNSHSDTPVRRSSRISEMSTPLKTVIEEEKVVQGPKSSKRTPKRKSILHDSIVDPILETIQEGQELNGIENRSILPETLDGAATPMLESKSGNTKHSTRNRMSRRRSHSESETDQTAPVKRRARRLSGASSVSEVSHGGSSEISEISEGDTDLFSGSTHTTTGYTIIREDEMHNTRSCRSTLGYARLSMMGQDKSVSKKILPRKSLSSLSNVEDFDVGIDLDVPHGHTTLFEKIEPSDSVIIMQSKKKRRRPMSEDAECEAQFDGSVFLNGDEFNEISNNNLPDDKVSPMGPAYALISPTSATIKGMEAALKVIKKRGRKYSVRSRGVTKMKIPNSGVLCEAKENLDNGSLKKKSKKSIAAHTVSHDETLVISKKSASPTHIEDDGHNFLFSKPEEVCADDGDLPSRSPSTSLATENFVFSPPVNEQTKSRRKRACREKSSGT